MADNASRLSYTTSYDVVLERCRILFIAVDTPPSPSGDADLSRVQHAVREIAARGGERLLVMKSTVPVGTGEKVTADLEALGADGITYASNPEFLREGAAIQDFLEPDRIVIGCFRDEDGAAVEDLYRGIDTDVVRTSVPTAEMVKYASNAFLATKISFINEIANVCEQVGADVRTVARGMGLDHRIGPHFLQAGIGYGGSCFPKDVQALKQLAGNTGYHFQLLNAVIEVNALQKRRVVGKLKERLGSLRGTTIALLGLTFKPNTDDLREAASIVLAGRLIHEGAHGPCVRPHARRRRSSAVPRRRHLPGAARRACRRPCCRARHRVAGVRAAGLGRRRGGHGPAPAHRRSQLRRPDDRRRGRPRVRGHRPGRRGPGASRPLSRMGAARGIPRQAVILVGGEGKRLRPVTSRVPKPVAPVVERPFVAYILDNLARHGVRRAIFSTGFLAEAIEAVVGDGAAYGLEVRYAVEDEPLGTAGAIANCDRLLDDGGFYVFNGDVLSDVDLGALAATHVEKGGMGTVFLTPVEDPRRYGLVELREDGSVESFVEKPGEWEGIALINAGVYVLEPEVLELIPRGRHFSIERGVFPKLAVLRLAVRLRGPRVLARHRHAGQLPAGALRHPRDGRSTPRWASSWASSTSTSPRRPMWRRARAWCRPATSVMGPGSPPALV